MELNYTLLSDGSSDRALLPILTWLLKEQRVMFGINPVWADLRRLPKPPKTLAERIVRAVDLYPCDLLFIHRDAEREGREKRVGEIEAALLKAQKQVEVSSVICVVPVRMGEAWLLFNEKAIRRAAGNPNSQVPLDFPPLMRLEHLPDPKADLYNLIRLASGLRGRRLKKLNARERTVRVAEYIEDFSPLRALPAFKALERDLEEVVELLSGNLTAR